MSKPVWDGNIPIRRYGLFCAWPTGTFLHVVYGEDINRAEKWGDLVKWVGGIRPAEVRRKKQ
jgi:hypothetical protein